MQCLSRHYQLIFYLLPVKAPSFQGAAANATRNKAQSEKTLPCFQMNPFDVAASAYIPLHFTLQREDKEPLNCSAAAATVPPYNTALPRPTRLLCEHSKLGVKKVMSVIFKKYRTVRKEKEK
ncbi:hypothetical protein JOB18_035044 [Solea senegalensis]|uniref:Uncharacterized protein n=1 Tax=Solea senegalensis TaxID=28829 RepID=A0AAV6T8Y5_SOLSE|nr:hypothetical protein JOB18_035044 [Solea senegalensis]